MNNLSIRLRSFVRQHPIITALALRLSGWMQNRKLKRMGFAVSRPEPRRVSVKLKDFEWFFRSDSQSDINQADSLREGLFAARLLQAVRPGDTVWDIGANIGVYTVVLAQACGENGAVVAFEPSPFCFERLRRNVDTNHVSNVTLINTALGDSRGNVSMTNAGDAQPFGRIVENTDEKSSPELLQVTMTTGDVVIRERGIKPPSIIKIDVEGFELEVVRGLGETLKADACRAVFCEVHFKLLEDRGNKFAPSQIQEMLKSSGFNRIDWIDASHLAAVK